MKEQTFVWEVNKTRKIPSWSDCDGVIYKDLESNEEFLRTDPVDGGWMRCTLHNEIYAFDGYCPKCHPRLELAVKIISTTIAIIIAGAWFIGFPLFAYLSQPK